MKRVEHPTTTTAWHAWKSACAIDLCPPEAVESLRRFGSHRFSLYLNRYASRMGHRGQVLRVAESKDAWHLLETHAQVGTTREGKRYKDWLFARAPDSPEAWLNAVEGGATVLMRGVVREYLRREQAAAFMESLQRPLGGGAEPSFTLEELLPDTVEPLGELAENEWRALAREQAERFFPSLSSRERIVLWAREYGISLGDPDLARWAGCRRSALHGAHTDSLKRLCQVLKDAYPDESPGIWLILARKTLEELNQLIFSKIIVEKRAARFFKKKRIQVESGLTGDEVART